MILRKRSIFEIALVFIVGYTIVCLYVYHLQTNYLHPTPYEFLSSILSQSTNTFDHGTVVHSKDRVNLPLIAHLYRNGTSHERIEFATSLESTDEVRQFPVIDNYPDGDAYLPWIHDVFISHDASKVILLAQNRRRCHTGKGNEHVMKNLEPQMALFQPIHLKKSQPKDSSSSSSSSIYQISSEEDANVKETRFQCVYHLYEHGKMIHEEIVFSQYPFNYEYATWRKNMDGMYETEGKGMAQFWLSSLEFHCPLPESIKEKLHNGVQLYLDLATIKSPVREPGQWMLPEVGKKQFDVYEHWGKSLFMQPIDQSTRWENIPISLHSLVNVESSTPKEKPYKLVACTWSSAAHNRRGDAVTLTDGKERLKEWISYNIIAGFDHVVVYDNSAANTNATNLKEVVDLFDSKHVTYIDWPCKICNNNRPAHDDPGERSSQYAAEASCRARFGPQTDWMAFLDPDEYLIPMGKYDNWKEVVNDVDTKEKRKILKFRSTRARPRVSLMEETYGYKDCPTREEAADESTPGVSSCLIPKKSETFLKTFNCEYIKSPKPERFQRAMKQLYRPDFVYSHFVHYATITASLVKRGGKVSGRNHPEDERFVDELEEGVMIHAKSTTPNEGTNRKTRCVYKKTLCGVGYECPDELPFSDQNHKDGFQFDDGGNKKYCNCWINRKAEDYWIPKLEQALNKL